MVFSDKRIEDCKNATFPALQEKDCVQSDEGLFWKSKASTVLHTVFISKLTIFKVVRWLTCNESVDIKWEKIAGSSQSSIGHWRLLINCWFVTAGHQIASHADVSRASSRVPAPLTGAGTRDEPLRTSAWEASHETPSSMSRLSRDNLITFEDRSRLFEDVCSQFAEEYRVGHSKPFLSFLIVLKVGDLTKRVFRFKILTCL